MIESSLLSAISLMVLFCYFDIRKVAGYAVLVDVGCALILSWLFMGTYSGAMTGLVASLWITLFLALIKLIWGYKRYERIVVRGVKYKQFRWVTYPPARLLSTEEA